MLEIFILSKDVLGCKDLIEVVIGLRLHVKLHIEFLIGFLLLLFPLQSDDKPVELLCQMLEQIVCKLPRFI